MPPDRHSATVTVDGNPELIERRVRLMAVLGILLTSFVIGGIATLLLYESRSTTQENQLFFTMELKASAIEAELGRLNNIAMQITSRTQIRKELERYLRGEIDRRALVDFTVPKLTDAMQSNSDVMGIQRLTADFEPVLQIGTEVPRALWPRERSTANTAVGVARQGRLVVSAPIRDRNAQTVGMDLVLFRDDRLRVIMDGFFDHLETGGGALIASVSGSENDYSYTVGEPGNLPPETALREQLARFAGQRSGGAVPLQRLRTDRDTDLVLSLRPIPDSDWVLVFYTDAARFYATARLHAATAALTVLALALLGIAVTQRAIQPLVTEISHERRSLLRLLRQNGDLLKAVEENEGRLQSVIDGAPAIIYIKDKDGRYLLVNSSYERLVERPREEIVGKYDYQLFSEEIAKSTRDTDIEVMVTAQSINVDEKAPQQGEVRDFLSTKFPLFDDKGAVHAVCGISVDITERKRIERRLALTQRTVDHAEVGVYWADAHGRLLYLNEAAREALLIGDNPLPALSVADVTVAATAPDWPRHWDELHDGGSVNFECEYRRTDGSTYPAEVHASRLAFDDQDYYIAVFHDISARREAQSRLKQSAAVFDYTAEAIVITDTQGVVLDVNPAFTEILGYTRDEVVGQTPSLWRSNLHDKAFYQDMWRSIIELGAWRGEIINRTKSGSVAPELVTVNAVRNERGEATHYVAIYTDISQIKESQLKLAHLAHHDALTNLPNRVLFNERLQHCLDRASRRNASAAVIFVDLDNFKHVNDSLGHVYGDQLLIEVADLLSTALRHDDTVARIGGDEFTILIEEVDDRGRLVSIIEKIIEAFDCDFVLGEARVRMTPSLGVAVSPDDGKDANTLMRNADAAMYRAKSLGRNTYQFYTEELTQQAFERMHIDSALRHAVARGEFELNYQPQFDLRNGELVGVEALIRWKNPELGQVSPDRFIPIAEDNGSILPIGEWVLHAACSQACAWLKAGLWRGTIAVNISGAQVRRGDLRDTVQRVLHETGLPAEHLELELTESFIMGESQQAIETLMQLRELGVTLAVDDFGTGYSSLAYLKSLPVHRLKIDKSFIRDIPEDPNDMAITRAVIALATSLNLDLVAEGIETETQRHFLLDEGCQFGQGHFFHRPLDADHCAQLLKRGMTQTEPTRQHPRAR